MLVNVPIASDTTGILSGGGAGGPTYYVELNNVYNLFIVDPSRLDDYIMPYGKDTAGKVFEITSKHLDDPDFLNYLVANKNIWYSGVQFKFTDIAFQTRDSSLASTNYSYFNFGNISNRIGLFRTHIDVLVYPQTTTFTAFFIGTNSTGIIRLSIIDILEPPLLG